MPDDGLLPMLATEKVVTEAGGRNAYRAEGTIPYRGSGKSRYRGPGKSPYRTACRTPYRPQSDELREIRADLADMIRHERRSRRHAFHLAIRIELHRADEVQRHLADLVRPRSRHESKEDDCKHLKRNQERVPAQEVHALDGLAHPFREKRSEEICTDRKQQIGCGEPFLLSQSTLRRARRLRSARCRRPRPAGRTCTRHTSLPRRSEARTYICVRIQDILPSHRLFQPRYTRSLAKYLTRQQAGQKNL